MGNVVSLPISGILADEVSWQSVFYVFGTLGVIWFVFWAWIVYDTPATHSRMSQVSFWKKIIKHKLVLMWEMCLGGARLHRVQHPFRERGQEAPLPATEEDIHFGALPHAHIRALRAELRYIFSHILKEVNIFYI